VDSRTNLQNEHGHHPRDGPESFSEFRRPVTPSEFHKRSQGKRTSPSAGVFLAVQPYRARSTSPTSLLRRKCASDKALALIR
jgi:hypothetical protein